MNTYPKWLPPELIKQIIKTPHCLKFAKSLFDKIPKMPPMESTNVFQYKRIEEDVIDNLTKEDLENVRQMFRSNLLQTLQEYKAQKSKHNINDTHCKFCGTELLYVIENPRIGQITGLNIKKFKSIPICISCQFRSIVKNKNLANLKEKAAEDIAIFGQTRVKI